MEQQPLVSVIINCYNGEKYLREAIDSVIAQTYTNWEIIFWDNQSTDSTAEIVKSYKDERIRYFYAPEHTPLGEARNLAMKEANGKFISFLDADDIWLSGFLCSGIQMLKDKSNLQGYYSNYTNLYTNSEINHDEDIQSHEVDLKELLNYYNIGMSGIILRYDTIRNNDIKFDKNYNLIEDLDFFVKVSSYGNLFYDSTPLFKYRIHAGSTSFKRSSEWHKEYKQFISQIRETYIVNNKLSENDLWRIFKVDFAAQLETCIMDDKRLSFIILFLRRPYYLRYYWRFWLFVFVGRDQYIKFRNRRYFFNR